MNARSSLLVISLLSVFSITFLASCGGGGGGGGGGVAAIVPVDGDDAGSIEGVGFKGPVRSGTIRAYTFLSNGSRGTLLASGSTDTTGVFDLELDAYTGPVWLEISSGTYTDEATGADVAVSAAKPLIGIIPNYTDGTNLSNISITPLTSIAASLASEWAADGVSPTEAATQANNSIAEYFGLTNIINTPPPDLTEPLGGTPSTNARNTALVIAGISELANDFGVSATDLVDALVDDIADGVFDGQGPLGQLNLGGTNLDSDTTAADLGGCIGDFVNGANNDAGVTIGQANSIITHSNTNEIRLDVPDDLRPELNITAPASGSADASRMNDIVFTFGEAMNTTHPISFKINGVQDGTGVVEYSGGWDDSTHYRLTLDLPLASNSAYTFTLNPSDDTENGFKSVAGHYLDSNTAVSFTTGQAKWTYMVYMAADNNLSEACRQDLNEMQLPNSDDVNIVCQFELSPSYSDIPSYDYNTYRAVLFRDILCDAGSPGVNWNMSLPLTLTQFIDWVNAEYPADKVCLVLWNHGGGWSGALQDETSFGWMDLQDLRDGIGNSSLNIDVLNYDACLMASYEVAKYMEGICDYLVASEEIEPGDGDPYNLILADLVANPLMSPAELAANIVSCYIEDYSERADSVVTKSAIDMSMLSSLETAITGLAATLESIIDTEWANIFSAREEAQSYQHEGCIDLYDFAYLLDFYIDMPAVNTAASQVMSIIDNMVLANGVYPESGALTTRYGNHSVEYSCGLSIYAPVIYQTAEYDAGGQTRNTFDTYYDLSMVTESWRNCLGAILFEDQFGQGYQPTTAAINPFTLVAIWDEDVDIDMYVFEPISTSEGGDWEIAGSYFGTTSTNGYSSPDDIGEGSGTHYEWYVSKEIVNTGTYHILLAYWGEGFPGETASVLFEAYYDEDDIPDASGVFNLDNSSFAPADWGSDPDEVTNVYNNVYSDWKAPYGAGGLSVSVGKARLEIHLVSPEALARIKEIAEKKKKAK